MTRRPYRALCREKRGEIEPEDLSGNLIVQLGLATDPGEARRARRIMPTPREHLFGGFARRRLPEAHARPSAVLVDELNSGTSQYRLDCGQRCCIACVPADLNIRDGVPMEPGCLREVPHHQA